MRKKLFAAALLCVSASAMAKPLTGRDGSSKALIAQVENLVALLGDAYASGYPEATIYERVKAGKDDYVLVVFTIEGFGGGNSFTQYLAAFTPDQPEGRAEYFTLVDVMAVGGKGWQGIEGIQTTVLSMDAKKRQPVFGLDAMVNTEDDAPNFPSQNAVLKVALKNGRLELLDTPAKP